MIQRIQTIYLSVSSLAMGLTLLFPFATYSIRENNLEFDALGFEMSKELSLFLPPVFPILLALILSVVTIFSFKNRKRQLTLNKINFVVVMVSIVFIFVDFNQIESAFSLVPENIDYGISFFFPVLAFVAVLMANRAIKQDEKLIKSMDRIR